MRYLILLTILFHSSATYSANKEFGGGKNKSLTTSIYLPIGDVTKQFDGTEFSAIIDSTQIIRDTLGNITEYNTHQQYFTGTWLNTYKVAFTYNSSNECIEEIIKNFNFISFQLQNTSKTLRTIDASHRLIDMTTFSWQANQGTWRNQTKIINSFSGNNLSLSIKQNWDTITSNWVNENKTNYLYNQFNQVKTINTQNYTNNSWNDYKRTDSLVWPNNTELEAPIQYIDFEWNSTSNQWMKTTKYIRTNTGFIKPFKEEELYWNGQIWQINTQINYLYDFNKNEIQRTTKLWNVNMSQFTPLEDVLRTWDAENKLIADSIFIFDNTGGLTGGKRNGYAYDANNNLLYDTIATYSLGNNEFNIDSRKKYYYNSFTANSLKETKIKRNNLLIQPNIVIDFATFSITEKLLGSLKIFNISGVTVKEQKMNVNSINLDLTGLLPGLYIVQFTALNGKILQSKFMKQ